MPYGTANVDTIQSSTAGTPVQFNDGNGTQVGTLCRAWVNFDGTVSTPSIRASFNVSSITKNSTSVYTVNFANALPDANYSNAVTGARDTTNYGYSAITVPYQGVQTTTTVKMIVYPSTTADYQYVSYQAFR